MKPTSPGLGSSLKRWLVAKTERVPWDGVRQPLRKHNRFGVRICVLVLPHTSKAILDCYVLIYKVGRIIVLSFPVYCENYMKSCRSGTWHVVFTGCSVNVRIIIQI